jgi:hypothetical protein
MLIARKIGLSLLSLMVASIVLLTIAYSFGLGYTVQNALQMINVGLLALWLWFTWRGRWVLALTGMAVTFVAGVFVVPFLSGL